MKKTLALNKLSIVEQAGLIRFFEMAFELSWKLLKDYLNAEGFLVKSPREAFKQAFQVELIASGNLWMEALDDRNLTSHTYNEQTAVAVETKIRNVYYPLLLNLQQSFATLVDKHAE